MKTTIFIILLLLIKLTASAQSHAYHPPNNEIALGFADQYDSLPKLHFTIVPQEEYDKLPQKPFWAKLKLKIVKGHFFIQTPAGKQMFKQYTDDGAVKGWSGYELLGYSPSLNYYALTSNSTSEGIGFSQLFLLDGKSGFRYGIVSFGDWHVSIPLPSGSNRYFAYYANTEYKHKNSDLGILVFNPKAKKGKAFKPVASLHSDEFAIEDLHWGGDTTLYIKGYEEVYENQKWVKKYRYYKTEIKQ